MSNELREKGKNEKTEQKKNSIAKGLFGLGITIITVALIATLILLIQSGETYGDETSALLINALTTAFSGIVSGSMFIGISEMINLLSKIYSKNLSRS